LGRLEILLEEEEQIDFMGWLTETATAAITAQVPCPLLIELKIRPKHAN